MKLLYSSKSEKYHPNASSVNTVVQLHGNHDECVETVSATTALPLEASHTMEPSTSALFFTLTCTIAVSVLNGYWLSISGTSLQIITVLLITCTILSTCFSIVMLGRYWMLHAKLRSGSSEFTDYVKRVNCLSERASSAVSLIRVGDEEKEKQSEYHKADLI